MPPVVSAHLSSWNYPAEVEPRVAIMADIHGNDSALEAALSEINAEAFDCIAILGDITWGTFPEETYRLLAPLAHKLVCIRGNADRAAVELAHKPDTELSERERWMVAAHSPEVMVFLESLPTTATITVSGLGDIRLSHGSPRTDIEVVTPETPHGRIEEFMSGVEQRCVATAHTHVSYVRRVGDTVLFNPGSVGMPYEGKRGAFWAALGPDIELRHTEYDVEGFVGRMLASDDPAAQELSVLMLEPPTREEAIAYAEKLVFSE